MSPAPAVRCHSCGYSWNSSSMAEGLRLLGSCPRCAGDLEFRDHAVRIDRFAPVAASAVSAPHLVLGIPRR